MANTSTQQPQGNSIIYTIIASSDQTILEYNPKNIKHHLLIVRGILRNIQTEKKCYLPYQNNNCLYYIHSKSVTYLCMTEGQFSKRLAFSYLEDIKQQFQLCFNISEIHSSNPHVISLTFLPIVQNRINIFTQIEVHQQLYVQQLQKIYKDIQEAQLIMSQNQIKCAEKDNLYQIMIDKVENIEIDGSQGSNFPLKQIKNKICCKSIILGLMAILIVAANIYFGKLQCSLYSGNQEQFRGK